MPGQHISSSHCASSRGALAAFSDCSLESQCGLQCSTMAGLVSWATLQHLPRKVHIAMVMMMLRCKASYKGLQ